MPSPVWLRAFRALLRAKTKIHVFAYRQYLKVLLACDLYGGGPTAGGASA